jgi:hypothetical protein
MQLGWIQQREEHWVIADLVGKGGHVRTVPMPAWVKDAIDAWTVAAGITEGSVFRAITKSGHVPAFCTNACTTIQAKNFSRGSQ